MTTLPLAIRVIRRTTITVAAVAMVLSGIPVALGQPEVDAEIVGVDDIRPTKSLVSVYSPAMDRIIPVEVLHPPGTTARPSYYLLDGVDSRPPTTNWSQFTDIDAFFADKQVNVILPVGGEGSYYSDWQRPDHHLGSLMRWETFLTRELPPLIDRQFHGNGRNAVGGVSMGAAAAAILATRHPALYRGVASFSGCVDATAPALETALGG
ncbi:alpha/beta hydrolase [Nocardia sp. NPDC052566]|uniref:alpha/beta hydrolase n=1 Tax=Nocardia sp. NPDC052566 TaxID=3364330 RepID=UPI0037CA8331